MFDCLNKEVRDPESLKQSGSENAAPACDEYGLPFESAEHMTELPPEFEEMAEALLGDMEDLFNQAAVYNRFSPHYLTICKKLEPIVRRAGRLCITKAVLEKKGYEFPKMENLSIWNLYCICGFNFRKCHDGFVTARESGQGIDLALLEWESRWYQLAERLKATESKIQKIQSGEINIDKLLERAETFHFEPKVREDYHEKISAEPIAVTMAPALPILKSVACEMVKQKKERDKVMNEIMNDMGKPFKPMGLKHVGEKYNSLDGFHMDDPFDLMDAWQP